MLPEAGVRDRKASSQQSAAAFRASLPSRLQEDHNRGASTLNANPSCGASRHHHFVVFDAVMTCENDGSLNRVWLRGFLRGVDCRPVQFRDAPRNDAGLQPVRTGGPPDGFAPLLARLLRVLLGAVHRRRLRCGEAVYFRPSDDGRVRCGRRTMVRDPAAGPRKGK
ncbi:hypothetical protein MRX96_045499, partial [Rhipicephalus microplus]